MKTLHTPVPRRYAARLLIAASCAFLSACGGSTPDTLPIVEPLTGILDIEGATLAASTPLVVRFSAAADPGTLRLSGALAEAGTATWNGDHTVLTLSPGNSGWSRGETLSVLVEVAGKAGQRLPSPLSGAWFVPLIFENGQSPDLALGQPDLFSRVYASSATASNIGSPTGPVAFTSSGRLVVPDYAHHRILFYDNVPTAQGASASFAIGQPDLVSQTRSISRPGLNYPTQVTFGAGKMAVADYTRVLIWNTEPTGFGSLPDVVVGQTSFTGELQNCSPLNLVGPEAVTITPQGQLLVVDSANNRVLVWHQVPADSLTQPDLVVGQSNMNTCEDNANPLSAGTPSLRNLSYPSDVWTDGQRLVVLDSGNNRALIWHQFPTGNFAPADVVLGQSASDKRATAAASAQTFSPYQGVASNGFQLALSDYTGNRVLVWDSFPTGHFQPADRVLGQADFVSSTHPGTGATAGAGFLPGGLLFRRHQLFVSDINGSRVLVFNSR
jgi:hypothetical protein